MEIFAMMIPEKSSPLPEGYAIPKYKTTYLGNGKSTWELVGYQLKYVTVILPKPTTDTKSLTKEA